MIKSLVLHIGDPKTGTSSIQRILFERQWTCATVTLDYPPVLNSLALAESLREGRLSKSVKEVFEPYAIWLEDSKADVAVISAEQFSGVEPALVHEAFATYAPAVMDRIRVLAYARPHVSRFVSAYSQRVKVGALNVEMAEFYDRPATSKVLGMHKRFMAWRAAFGAGLVVRPMIRSEILRGDVVADCLGVVLGTEDFSITGSTEANISLPLEALAGLRLIQTLLKKNDIPFVRRQAVGDRINTLVTADPKLRGAKVGVDRALYARLKADYLPDAEAMDAEFFAGPIMVKALAAAEKDAAAEPVSTLASAHFGPGKLSRLRKAARKLATELGQEKDVWTKAHKRDKGRKPYLLEDATLSNSAPEEILRVEGLLAEMAAILARP